jgi:DNA-binding NarL/FixJ family response regulator
MMPPTITMGASATPQLTRPTVLLVDDDERIRRTLTLLLRWSGDWEVVGAAPDGVAAVELAADRQPDLVLLDRWLGDGDGLCVVPRLRALARPPLVVMLSAEVDPVVHQQALELGAAGCLEKTMPPLELLRALRELIAPQS